MPASLADLQRDLTRAIASGDADRIASVRRTIADAHPETEAGAEASYRLGLHLLFTEKKVDEAADRFRGAAKAKSETWSPRGRVSLGILLYHQGKMQQAVFELRKVSTATPPTLASAQALGFLVLMHRETNNAKEADRLHDLQLAALGKLTASQDREAASLAHWMLAMEHKFDGDRKKARENLQSALQKGGLDEETRGRVQSALDEL